jgi:leucyl-tRNA synthetase
MGPLEQVKPWQTSGLQGVRRFLDRVHGLSARELSDSSMDLETARLVHRTLRKVGEDIEALRFNTAVSSMMILSNHLSSLPAIPREALEKLVLCLSPFAPHLSEELWEKLGHAPSIADVAWPNYDPAFCVDERVEIAVQVNGRVRGRIELATDASEEAAVAAALEEPHVQKYVEGRPLRKVVYVPGRILNLILG